MKQFLETTYGKAILVVIVAAVWGVNFFTFSGIGDSEEKAQQQVYASVMEGEYTVPVFEQYTYESGNRNPFQIPEEYNESQQPIRQQEPAEEDTYQQPVLFLTGIMDETAIIRDKEGNTFLMEEEETFNNILVKSIYRDSVVLIHESRAFTINLN